MQFCDTADFKSALRRRRVQMWYSPETVQPIQLLDSGDVATWIVGSKTDTDMQLPQLTYAARLLHSELR
jgi:hypothetical protein